MLQSSWLKWGIISCLMCCICILHCRERELIHTQKRTLMIYIQSYYVAFTWWERKILIFGLIIFYVRDWKQHMGYPAFPKISFLSENWPLWGLGLTSTVNFKVVQSCCKGCFKLLIDPRFPKQWFIPNIGRALNASISSLNHCAHL